MYTVEARGIRPKSNFCFFGSEWENTIVGEDGQIEDYDVALEVYNYTVEDEKGSARVHEIRLAKDGKTVKRYSPLSQ